MNEEQGNDFEVEGWMSIEEEGEEDNASEYAEESFRKAIEAGNQGAYSGLGSITKDNEKKIKYLELAAFAGSLDLMWELYLSMDDCVEKFAWLTIVANNNIMPDAEDELEISLKDLSSDKKAQVSDVSNNYLKKIEDGGCKLGTGMHPYY